MRELPDRVLQTYSRLWQMEIWLRRMVYVELRALLGDDWATKIRGDKAEWPLKEDKRLTHMPTPEEDPLSYVQLSKLRRIVHENWRLFEPFLPPEKIWDAKMDEVAQIRHRVAHFRSGHEDDLQRVVQLLRDVDQGFWRFCTSYNNAKSVLPQSGDPVVAHFLPYDLLPWVEVEKNSWARVGSVDPTAVFGMTVETICRPWTKWAAPVAGMEGILYDVTLHVRGSRYLEFSRLLENTQTLHKHFVHIMLSNHADDIRITIPAILGEKPVIEIVERFVESARSCILPGRWPTYKGTIQKLADSLPEPVLGPANPLTFLSKDQPCSFFGV